MLLCGEDRKLCSFVMIISGNFDVLLWSFWVSTSELTVNLSHHLPTWSAGYILKRFFMVIEIKGRSV